MIRASVEHDVSLEDGMMKLHIKRMGDKQNSDSLVVFWCGQTAIRTGKMRCQIGEAENVPYFGSVHMDSMCCEACKSNYRKAKGSKP